MKKTKKITVLEIPYHATFHTKGCREFDVYKKVGAYNNENFEYETKLITYDHETYQNQDIEELISRGEETAVERIDANIALGKVISETASQALRKGNKVLMVGGNCGHAVGLAGGIQRAIGTDKKIGLIWLDAHGDVNIPETSKSGMIGGMPLAVCGGLCLEDWRQETGLRRPIEENNIILTDARNMDEEERELLQKVDFNYIDTVGFNDSKLWEKEIKELAERVDVIYFHIDADILDGKHVPNHETIEYNGIELEKLIENSKIVMETGKVIAFALVSIYFPNKKEGQEVATLSGIKILENCLSSWK